LPEVKRIRVCLPQSLVEEIDNIILAEKCSRSKLIQEAMWFYVTEKKRQCLHEEMKRGYMEMAQINLRLALEDTVEDVGWEEIRFEWAWERK